MSVKIERIASLIQKELAPIIQNKLNDPMLNFVSVTDVEVTNDLSYAKIFVSFLDEDNVEKGLEALNRAKGLLRTEVAKLLETRKTPELIFEFDPSIHTGARIEEILKKIEEE